MLFFLLNSYFFHSFSNPFDYAMGNHEITETSPSVFVTSWETLY